MELSNIIDFLTTQFYYYVGVKPTFSRKVKEIYKLNKNLIKNKLSDYNLYMPLNTQSPEQEANFTFWDERNPNFEDKMIINHIRLWTFLGNRYLNGSQENIANEKLFYFNYFKIQQNKPAQLCYLCQMYNCNTITNKCGKCNEMWKQLNKFKFYNTPCNCSYYILIARYFSSLTTKQRAYICYQISQLFTSELKTDFYKLHMYADISPAKIDKAYDVNEIKRLKGIYEPEPLYKDIFRNEVK